MGANNIARNDAHQLHGWRIVQHLIGNGSGLKLSAVDDRRAGPRRLSVYVEGGT
jgi:hypothetical protein